MNLANLKKWNGRIFCVLFLFIIILEFTFLICYVGAAKKKQITGYSKSGKLNADDSISYGFLNDNQFKMSTNVYTEFRIEYDEKIENREISMDVSSNNRLYLEITSKRSIESFGTSKKPNDPEKNGVQVKSQYKCIYRIRSNRSIEEVKFEFKKDSEKGLDPLAEYSIAVYEEEEDSWKLINTEEKVDDSNSETYLTSTLKDLDSNTDYYITIYEVGYGYYVWIWLIVVFAIGIISITILISKKDYIHYLKTRTTSIEKGAHRLTLEEVLENDNRNRIIDLILEEPGIHFNELLRKTELAAGNLVWHLDILETYKIIGKKRISNFIVYFPYYNKNPISNIDLKLMKSKLTLEVLELIEEKPGIWNNLITNKLKVDHKTIHYHIKKLIELDLINIEKEGRKKKIFPNLDSEYFSNRSQDDNQ